MIIVGIDVAKDKHDCVIINSEGEVFFNVFTMPNTIEGFELLLANIKSVSDPSDTDLRRQDTTATICSDSC